MSSKKVLGGTTESRPRVDVAFTFYAGPASVRETEDDLLEVGFYAPAVKPKLPMEGLVAGEKVTALSIKQSGLGVVALPKSSRTPLQFIVVTVRPVPSE